eukprot:scaffold265249_cov26-Tisochrysis_lutea.AAC.2
MMHPRRPAPCCDLPLPPAAGHAPPLPLPAAAPAAARSLPATARRRRPAAPCHHPLRTPGRPRTHAVASSAIAAHRDWGGP